MQWLAGATDELAAQVRAQMPPANVPAAVLVPLVERHTGLTVLLTQRAETLKDHAGQISFPGGRIEPDDRDAWHAALREASDACTIVTDMLTGRPARYMRNALTDDLIASGLPPIAFPAQMSVTAPLQETGDREVTLLFAGQSAPLGRDMNATALVEAIAEETTLRLRAFAAS